MLLSFINILNSSNQYLYGTVHKTIQKSRGTVLIVHGHLSSNRIGPHRLYYEISKSLCSEGYDVFRFDLRGMGESDGTIESTRFEDHVNDVISILDELIIHNCTKPIFLVSHCIGCNVVLDVMNHSEYIEKAVFVAPFFSNEKSLLSMFSETQLLEMNTKGYTYRKGIYTSKSFFLESCSQSIFLDKLRKVQNRVCLIYGDEDQYIPHCDCKEIFHYINQNELFIEGGDHNFISRDSREQLIDLVASILNEEIIQ